MSKLLAAKHCILTLTAVKFVFIVSSCGSLFATVHMSELLFLITFFKFEMFYKKMFEF